MYTVIKKNITQDILARWSKIWSWWGSWSHRTEHCAHLSKYLSYLSKRLVIRDCILIYLRKKKHIMVLWEKILFFFFFILSICHSKTAQAYSRFKTGFNGDCINNNKAKPQQWEQCSLLEASGFFRRWGLWFTVLIQKAQNV